MGLRRGPVDEALAQLQQEGVIERRVGDGSYIAQGAASMAKAAGAAPPVVRPLSLSAKQVLERFSAYLGKPQHSEVPHVLLASQPLFPRAPNHAEFPLETWRRLINRAHGEAYRDHLNYGPAAGLPQLREAIARHLSLTRGMRVSAQQVVVVNSATHGIELIARVLLEPGDTVWLEDPGHSGMVHLFQVLRNTIAGVPVDAQGLDVAPAACWRRTPRRCTSTRSRSTRWACARPRSGCVSCCNGPTRAAPGSSRATSTTRSCTAAACRRRCRAWTPPTA